MSEPGERSYEGVQEEKNEEIIQEGVEARVEEETAAAEALTAIPGKQETIAKEKDSEQQEKARERVKRPKKNKASKSRRKDKDFDITAIAKHLEIQTNHLAKLEKALQPLRKLAISLDTQSKMVKEINASVKQLQRQIIQVQKTIQKGKTRRN